MSARQLGFTLLLSLALSGSAGCVQHVKPWEKEVLARKDMAWSVGGIEDGMRSSVFFSKEAALPGGSAGGGGCGCN